VQSAVAPGNDGHTQNWAVGKKGPYSWSEPFGQANKPEPAECIASRGVICVSVSGGINSSNLIKTKFCFRVYVTQTLDPKPTQIKPVHILVPKPLRCVLMLSSCLSVVLCGSVTLIQDRLRDLEHTVFAT